MSVAHTKILHFQYSKPHKSKATVPQCSSAPTSVEQIYMQQWIFRSQADKTLHMVGARIKMSRITGEKLKTVGYHGMVH